LGTLAVGTFALAGCGATSASPAQSRGQKLAAKACTDIVTTMTPLTGTAIIRLNFQELVAAVHQSPNAKLHSEVALFENDAAHPVSGGGYLNEASAMLRTCRQLGFGG
jgi:hypothetical protein